MNFAAWHPVWTGEARGVNSVTPGFKMRAIAGHKRDVMSEIVRIRAVL